MIKSQSLNYYNPRRVSCFNSSTNEIESNLYWIREKINGALLEVNFQVLNNLKFITTNKLDFQSNSSLKQCEKFTRTNSMNNWLRKKKNENKQSKWQTYGRALSIPSSFAVSPTHFPQFFSIFFPRPRKRSDRRYDKQAWNHLDASSYESSQKSSSKATIITSQKVLTLEIFFFTASRYAGDTDRPGQAGPRHGEAERRGTGAKIWVRGGLLQRRTDVVAKTQAANVVSFRWTLLLEFCQGRYSASTADHAKEHSFLFLFFFSMIIMETSNVVWSDQSSRLRGYDTI